MTMKTNIKKIAQSNCWNVTVIRHGIHTEYILVKGIKILVIGSTTRRGVTSYTVDGSWEFNHNTDYSYYRTESLYHWGYPIKHSHTLANGQFAAELTAPQIECIIMDN